MAKRVAGLTARGVETAKEEGLRADGGGLYLQTAASGAKSWLFRFQLAGKRRSMGLGSLDVCTLAEARQKAADARKLVADGKDPIEQKRALAAAAAAPPPKRLTFAECAQSYIVRHQRGWKNPLTASNWARTFANHINPVLGALPVDQVEVRDVLQVLDAVWEKSPHLTTQLRIRMEKVLGWAKVGGDRTGENPARWKENLDQRFPKLSSVHHVKHFAALPYAEIVDFVTELRRHREVRRGVKHGTVSVTPWVLEFAILTASRPGNAASARWDEISLHERLWTIPAERMKKDREHRVPLTAPAMAILDEMQACRRNEFVFPGTREGRPITRLALRQLVGRMGRLDVVTPHGFRSTFTDWVAEQTHFPEEVRKMAIAHIVKDRSEAAYRRGDLFGKRRLMMEAWARFVTAAPSEKVVTLPRRRAAQ